MFHNKSEIEKVLNDDYFSPLHLPITRVITLSGHLRFVLYARKFKKPKEAPKQRWIGENTEEK